MLNLWQDGQALALESDSPSGSESHQRVPTSAYPPRHHGGSTSYEKGAEKQVRTNKVAIAQQARSPFKR